MRCTPIVFALLAGTLPPLSPAVFAKEMPDAEQAYQARFQATYVWQDKSSFPAAYSGPNSLATRKEKSYSFTATAYFGVRPWSGGELYFNPELAQGVPLSGLTGLGGFSNGEMARVSGPNPVVYRARLFVRQTWGLGGEQESIEADFNQLAGKADRHRVVVTFGNLSALDIFDDNTYSHDPRTQFLNWALMTHGAYDYPADARGYSWGGAIEYYRDRWAFRAGRFLLPREPNALKLNPRIFASYGDQIEIERAHEIAGQAGKLRVLLFRDVAVMSRFADALDRATASGSTPDLNAVRDRINAKTGAGVSLEQGVSSDAGMFARASWADGRTETEAFAEIDRSVSAGIAVKGSRWGRAADTLAIAFAQNQLSPEHRAYLAQGGMGFFIGDGRLRYRPETIVEAYYSVGLVRGAWLTLNAQRIFNPAYNADRGPASIGTLRLHVEY